MFTAFIIAAIPAKLQAQEHSTEHPKKEAALSPEDLAKEIEKYVQNESKTTGGYFLFYDEKTETELKLTLEKVHKERLSKIDDGLYFACSDFIGSDRKIYDLDFFINETESDLEVIQQSLNKVDGKARYSWYEEVGVWKQQQK